jgi:hypothetical protein
MFTALVPRHLQALSVQASEEEEQVRAPKVSSGGNVPGTSWYVVPVCGSRNNIPDLHSYVVELLKVRKWLAQEIAWASYKSKRLKEKYK